jgi:predicted dehydrogenase
MSATTSHQPHDTSTTGHPTRRAALKTSLAVGAGVWLGTSRSARAASANERLNIAFVGIGGQGAANLRGLRGENVVALCDVDDQRAGDAYERFPQAKKFHDFRRMFDEIAGEIDAVAISTPDHTHFHAAYAAMQLGKHVYLEKPMAHSVEECRILTNLAREKGLATQLGVQRHTIPNMHRIVELIRAGAIGDVEEVHSWIEGNRGMPEYPPQTAPVPPHLKWDLWLGPARERPFSPAYAPYGWRFWWDFGTGEMGNWGCHILDIPFWALDLKYPARVEATGPEPHPQTSPRQMHVRYEFPHDGTLRPPVTLHWYHAENGPDILREHGLDHSGMNTLFIGSEGMLLCGFNKLQLLPANKFADYTPPEPSIPDSPGFHQEWIAACKGGPPATCHFDYSGPLAETVLLGNVAYRSGQGFDWKAEQLEAKGSDRAAEFLHSTYREGWQIT